jgi:hypothetical protein
MPNPVHGLIGRSLAAATPHPIASAVQFAAVHDDPKTPFGASMNVNTGKMAIAGKSDGYAVGKVPGRNGSPVPTSTASRRGARVGLGEVIHNTIRVRNATAGQPDAHVGSWYDSGTRKVEYDASELVRDKGAALGKAKTRGEKAIFDMRNVREIRVK